MPLRLDNARALPHAHSRKQQTKKTFKQGFKVDQAASPMPETRQPERPAPRATSSEWWARSSRNPGRDQIGTPGRDHRNQQARLARHGFDQHSINAEVYLLAVRSFWFLRHCSNTAQNRRISLLREIKDQRWPRRAPKGHYLADKKAGNRGKKGLGISP